MKQSSPPPSERGKLTRQQVLSVRSLVGAGATLAQIAREFGVSWNAIQKILDDDTRAGVAPLARGGMRTKDGDDTFHEALEAAGVRRVRFHDLRHYAESWIIPSGLRSSLVPRRVPLPVDLTDSA